MRQPTNDFYLAAGFRFFYKKNSIFAIAVMADAGRKDLAGRYKVNRTNIEYAANEIFDGAGLVG